MSSSQLQLLDHLVNLQRSIHSGWITYWQLYSNFSTWEFWLSFVLLAGPLVLLYLTLDREKAFRVGFYGFNVHVWFGYIDAFGTGSGLWVYPFKVLPIYSSSLALEASFVPVVYMLVYQWTLNRRRNYYLYAGVLSAALAFVLKPLLAWMGMFFMYQWMNYVYLFLGYITVMLVSKWITDFFAHLQKTQGNRRGQTGKDHSYDSTQRGLWTGRSPLKR